PVEGLLVEPAREERGDLGIVDGAGGQERAQIDDGVALDLLHVAESADGGGAQRMTRDVVPGDSVEIQRARAAHPGVEVERGGRRHGLHGLTRYYGPRRGNGGPGE